MTEFSCNIEDLGNGINAVVCPTLAGEIHVDQAALVILAKYPLEANLNRFNACLEDLTVTNPQVIRSNGTFNPVVGLQFSDQSACVQQPAIAESPQIPPMQVSWGLVASAVITITGLSLGAHNIFRRLHKGHDFPALHPVVKTPPVEISTMAEAIKVLQTLTTDCGLDIQDVDVNKGRIIGPEDHTFAVFKHRGV
jgi:hypothetical protein